MITRRKAIKMLGLGGASLASTILFPRFHFGKAFAQNAGGSHVLVTLYLSGGWDGCAIAQPASGVSYDACRAARPTLTKTPEQLRLITGDLGLHPEWTFMQQAFQSGEAIVFPTAGIHIGNSGSHEEATLDVIKGLVDGRTEIRTKGFLADILDKKYQGRTAAEFLAFDMTSGNSVLNDSALQVIKAGNISNLGFSNSLVADSNLTQDTIYLLSAGWQGSDRDRLVQNTVRTLESTQTRIKEAISGSVVDPVFPQSGVGNAFRQAFIAINSFIDSGLEAVSMSRGGFDTHNNQDPTVSVNQQPMGLSAGVREIDTALQAFAQNLKRANLWNRVTVLFITEFGRTARENGSRGTDHGQGTTYFMVGGSVNGGQVVGAPIAPGDFNRGSNSFPVSVPFSTIVAQVSEKMGVPASQMYSSDILSSLPQLPPLFRA